MAMTPFRFAVDRRPAPPVQRRRPVLQRWLGVNPDAWGFVLPAVVIILGLSIIPMVWSLILSLQSADLITPAEWVGMANYRALSQDPNFRDAC